ncbi:unnamed protein product [Rotaria sp. Silwood2]|nr:unnamed protein product [Rotaria sp. Silwood2]CAF2868939.1 unnamed protein product [Rotaria sp. Silwood2]CAF3122044.1 unnamed protein product [Rotaria sp. Silwood2]CAF3258933.1 unnamed protein product [Rotaria sp. Silwood2]CAF4063578.1 unnamed protein product [Rotaria sp. Silwood2]
MKYVLLAILLDFESILAFLCSRRICRLSWSIFQPAVYSRRTSIFVSFLSIVSLLSSVAAVQQQVVNQQEQRTPSLSSIISTNGTTTIFNSSRRRIHTTMSLLSSTILSTTTTPPPSTTIIINDKVINNTNATEDTENDVRNSAQLIIIIIICSLMCILTIVGNLVVILAVSLVRKLQTASNILIVSLAVSDIFVGLFIMPLALVLEISGTWILGSIMCDIWTSTDVLLCTSSILNFLVISIDRYCIINHPFKYAPMRKVKLLSLMIAGVWILSALVSLPPILGWGRPSENLPICQVNPTLAYQIFATMLSFYIPLIIVLIIYANIYRTARTAMDPRSSVQMSQFLTNHGSTANVGHTSEILDQQLNGNSCSNPQLFLSVSNANTNDDNTLATGGGRILKRSENSPPQRSKSSTLLSPTRCLGRRISTTINGRLSVFVARRYSIFRHVHLPNQKAIRTLGVILGTFIVCWLPFMLFAIIKPLHEHITGLTGTPKRLNVPIWVDSVLLWFGYSSSMLNPLIYSKFNREFRTPFREIIYCRCKGLNEKIRRQEYLENLYGDQHLQIPAPSHIATTTRNSGNAKAAV